MQVFSAQILLMSTNLETTSHQPADSELVSLAAGGDTAAFDELVTRYRGKVYALAMNMVKSDADAWDLSQEAFIKAWKALPAFKEESRFYTWLYRITHNVCYDWMRKRRLRDSEEFEEQLHADSVAVHAPTAPQVAELPDRAADHRELGAEIATAINKLSEDHRVVVLLREVNGLSYEEIAEVTDASTGTVMSRLFYARKKLQSLLQETYDSL